MTLVQVDYHTVVALYIRGHQGVWFSAQPKNQPHNSLQYWKPLDPPLITFYAYSLHSITNV